MEATLLTDLDNGFYNRLRLKLVEKGVWPDYKDFTGDESAMKSAIDNIGKSDIMQPIQPGPHIEREDVDLTKIYIDRLDPLPSELGTKSDFSYEYREQTDDFVKRQTPDGVFDVQYQVSYNTNNMLNSAKMDQFIFQAFGTKGFIYAMDDALENNKRGYTLRYNGSADTSGEKYIEKTHRFTVYHVDIIGDIEIGIVPRMREIDVSLANILPLTTEQLKDESNFKP